MHEYVYVYSSVVACIIQSKISKTYVEVLWDGYAKRAPTWASGAEHEGRVGG
jgi:hypothetical protein